jgi:thiol peroxidase
MVQTRVGEAFEADVHLTVLGPRLSPGDPAPSFVLDRLRPGDAFPRPVRLEESGGSVRILNVINSIDTAVCHVETCQWEHLNRVLPAGVRLSTISMDLPFALARWGAVQGAEHELLSSHRSERFGMDYGVLLAEWRLLQRAVFVIDDEDRIAHAEYVPDQMDEPDYEAALAVVERLTGQHVPPTPTVPPMAR